MVQDTFASNIEICYEILLYLSSRLMRLQPGDVLEFVTGDPTANEKIPPWCDARGYTLLESGLSEDGRQRFLIQK
ncbi:MAG: sulfurtransferase TusA family protein [Chloroflexota bacterium]